MNIYSSAASMRRGLFTKHKPAEAVTCQREPQTTNYKDCQQGRIQGKVKTMISSPPPLRNLKRLSLPPPLTNPV